MKFINLQAKDSDTHNYVHEKKNNTLGFAALLFQFSRLNIRLFHKSQIVYRFKIAVPFRHINNERIRHFQRAARCQIRFADSKWPNRESGRRCYGGQRLGCPCSGEPRSSALCSYLLRRVKRGRQFG